MASLCSRLAARGHDVTLITLDDGRRDRHRVDPAVKRKHLNVMSNSRGWLAKFSNTRNRVLRVRAAINATAPEVVLSFCDRTNILTLMAARGLSLPVIVSERSDPAQQQLGTAWEWLRNRTYRSASSIVALTDASAQHLRSRFGVPVTVIPSAVDPPPLESNRSAARSTKRIVAAGRLEYEKGFDRLLDVFAGLPETCSDWSLRILGEGSARADLERQVASLNLSDRVTMPGWVEPIWEELASATMFVLPSRYEGFPSALMEAMAMGVPSIAVDCESGPRAVIRDPSWGMLVPNEVGALSAGIRRLIEEPEYREQLGQAGKQVVEQFGWDAMIERYESLLAKAAAR
jgi:glycosyltransferase involved in cell wall biosynthesis